VGLFVKEILSLILDVDSATAGMLFAGRLPTTIAIALSNTAGLFQQLMFVITFNSSFHHNHYRQNSKKVDGSFAVSTSSCV
jgi:hypothetical protein